MHLDVTMDDVSKATVKAHLFNAKGVEILQLPAGFTINFASSDATIASVNPLADGFSAEIVAVAAGACTVTVSTSDANIAPSDVGVTVTVSGPATLTIELGPVGPQ